MLFKILSNRSILKTVNEFNFGVFRKQRRLRVILHSLQSSQLHDEKCKDEYTLRDFMKPAIQNLSVTETNRASEEIPYINSAVMNGDGQKGNIFYPYVTSLSNRMNLISVPTVYFEIYGCQMNTNDAEVAWAILQGAGYQKTTDINEADIVLLITCAIRSGAESKIWARLTELSKLKKERMLSEVKLRPKVGLLGMNLTNSLLI